MLTYRYVFKSSDFNNEGDVKILKIKNISMSHVDLATDELAFYDALETNDSAIKVLGDDQLRAIARGFADKVRA